MEQIKVSLPERRVRELEREAKEKGLSLSSLARSEYLSKKSARPEVLASSQAERPREPSKDSGDRLNDS